MKVAERLRHSARVTLIVLAAIQAWAHRYSMNPDGISYLDMGRAAAAGHWAETLNGYWSPLYPWIIGAAIRVVRLPTYWDFTLAHAVNFAIFIVALLGFEFLLRALRPDDQQYSSPRWLNSLFPYAAFGWTMLVWIGLAKISPDLAVAAIVFIASGFAARIVSERAGVFDYIGLGTALGLGYLAKGAMLPLALAFIVPVWAVGRRRARGATIVIVAFTVVALPFIMALSAKLDRLTAGDVAKLNYAWFVSGVKIYKHWRGDPPGTGTPAHPTRKIADEPPAYEFNGPIGGTYPVWYDPAYWHEGMQVPIKPAAQIKQLIAGVQELPWMFVDLFVAAVALLVLLLRGHITFPRHFALVLGTPLLLALSMYTAVHVEPRFLGGFVGVGLTGAFLLLQARNRGGREAAVAVFVAVGALLSARMVQATGEDVGTILQQAEAGPLSHTQWLRARELKRAGIQSGERVAFIGDSFRAYWAYLGRYRIVAESPALRFWSSPSRARARTLHAFARRGVTTVVADARYGCALDNEWTYIPQAQLCVLSMKPKR